MEEGQLVVQCSCFVVCGGRGGTDVCRCCVGSSDASVADGIYDSGGAGAGGIYSVGGGDGESRPEPRHATALYIILSAGVPSCLVGPTTGGP